MPVSFDSGAYSCIQNNSITAFIFQQITKKILAEKLPKEVIYVNHYNKLFVEMMSLYPPRLQVRFL